MDFDFFHKLSSADAKKFLSNFLEETSKGFLTMSHDMKADNITVDFSIESLLPVFKWIVLKLKTLPENEDTSLPVWIRETESYKKGLYTFDQASKILILRYSYYWGECFVRNNTGLVWAVGRKNTMQQHSPVVSGFKNKMEMSVMLISENMFSKSIENNETDVVETSIGTWISFVN